MSPYRRLAAALLLLAALPACAYRPVYQNTVDKAHAYALRLNMKQRMTRSEGDPVYGDLIIKGTATERVLEKTEEKAALALEFSNLAWEYYDTGRLKESRKPPTFRLTFERGLNGLTTSTKLEGDTYKELQGTKGMFDLLLTTQEGLHIPFPDREIDTGDTWTVKGNLHIADAGSLAFTTAYKCLGVTTLNEKQYLQVEATTSSEQQQLHTTLQHDGQQIKLDLTMKFGGTVSVLFDLAAGEIYRAVVKQDSQELHVLTAQNGETFTVSVSNKIDGTIRKSNTEATPPKAEQ